jgi:hypothetical protein
LPEGALLDAAGASLEAKVANGHLPDLGIKPVGAKLNERPLSGGELGVMACLVWVLAA